jgi:hypothetical protein
MSHRCLSLVLVAALLAPAIARADAGAAPPVPQEQKLVVAQRKIVSGIVVADVGVAALVGGIILMSIAASNLPAVVEDAALANRLQIAGAPLIAFGVPAIVVGLALWLDGRNDKKEAAAAKKVSWLPTPWAGPQGAGVGLQLRF